MSKTSKKRNIDQNTPIADICPLGNGQYALNARNGIACTLTGAQAMQETLHIQDKALGK